MAIQQVTVCDICQEPDAETFSIGVNDRQVVVDLCPDHSEQLNSCLEPFIDGGRSAATTTRGRRSAAAKNTQRTSTKASRSDVAPGEYTLARKWAQENGIDVPSRGRLPGAVLERYRDSINSSNGTNVNGTGSVGSYTNGTVNGSNGQDTSDAEWESGKAAGVTRAKRAGGRPRAKAAAATAS